MQFLKYFNLFKTFYKNKFKSSKFQDQLVVDDFGFRVPLLDFCLLHILLFKWRWHKNSIELLEIPGGSIIFLVNLLTIKIHDSFSIHFLDALTLMHAAVLIDSENFLTHSQSNWEHSFFSYIRSWNSYFKSCIIKVFLHISKMKDFAEFK